MFDGALLALALSRYCLALANDGRWLLSGIS
jgi:hypothetical protein